MSMVDITDDTRDFPTLSWRAILAGGITTASLSLVLVALGVGLGLSSISPWAGEGVSATTFKVGAGVYLVAVSMLSSTIGGYLAGRLRTRWVGVHDHEIYFRDTAHGLVVWAFATVLTAWALGGAMGHLVGGVSASLGSTAVGAAGVSAGNTTDIYVDNLLRVDPTNSVGGASRAGSTQSSSPRAELGRLLAPTLQKGRDISATDLTYAAKVVSARTGLGQADAEARVATVITQAQKAADDDRKATASLALWLAGSLLAGAVASMLGATEGGLLRDSKWYEPNWRSTITRKHI